MFFYCQLHEDDFSDPCAVMRLAEIKSYGC